MQLREGLRKGGTQAARGQQPAEASASAQPWAGGGALLWDVSTWMAGLGPVT